MRILQIDTDCTDNGEGLRTTIYISGCWHGCKGCHNEDSWDEEYGVLYTNDELIEIINDNPLANVTISGGDGLTFQYDKTLRLLKDIKYQTDKTIWLYTGYEFEALNREKPEALNYIDVLVDGRFNLMKKDLNLLFRGSSNQRIIDVKSSLSADEVVLWRNGEYN